MFLTREKTKQAPGLLSVQILLETHDIIEPTAGGLVGEGVGIGRRSLQRTLRPNINEKREKDEDWLGKASG